MHTQKINEKTNRKTTSTNGLNDKTKKKLIKSVKKERNRNEPKHK